MHVPSLDCHAASSEERIQAFQNVFDVWPHADTLTEHLDKRLASKQHQRAEWFVGCEGERVVTALGCYPLRFHVHGELVEGFAIGSVHTALDCRGQGYAPRLLDCVEQHQVQHNRRLGILFSDIPAAYYARLGYVTCPAWEGRLDLNTIKAIPPAPIKLAEFNPLKEIKRLQETYTRLHAKLPIAIARTADYWDYLINKGIGNRYYWLLDEQNRPQGYVCLKPEGRCVIIEDFAVRGELEPELITAILKQAQAEGFQEVGGWLPDTPAFAGAFMLTQRVTEQTMLKTLGGVREIDPEMRRAAGRIHEIDHV